MGKLVAFILPGAYERKYCDENSNGGSDDGDNSLGDNSIVHDQHDFHSRAHVLFGSGRSFRGSSTVWVGEQTSRLGS